MLPRRSPNSGSSPLTRGKHGRELGVGRGGGLIPAHAGKTVRRGGHLARGRAHPRSRGENVSISMRTRPAGGSSPLTRGKQDRGRGSVRRRGLIPAHAGKTVRSGTRRRRAGAHPRSRGENDRHCLHAPPDAGSSPLTRGKRWMGERLDGPRGLIPAHAGKTTGAGTARGRAGAHPRSRGENHFYLPRPKRPRGSSPLTRGKRHPLRPCLCHGGLIPAHAGKTSSWT